MQIGAIGRGKIKVPGPSSAPRSVPLAGAADPSLTLIINSDRMQAYERFAVRDRQTALREAVEFEIHLVEGEEVDAIVRFPLTTKQTFS